MRMFALSRFSLCASLTAMLGGCGGSQPPIGAPGGIAQSRVIAARTTSAGYKLLYTFGTPCRGRCAIGAYPQAPLIAVSGTLYGTTLDGGTHRHGIVFSITPGGKERVLHNFGKEPDGTGPGASLLDVGGTLYGTTLSGGAHDNGTVFSITPGGKEKVLYSFLYGSDGGAPAAPLIDVNGRFYGTTSEGGGGYGTVFSITPGGTEKTLYSFAGGMDGAHPSTPLVELNGTLYGTTRLGGGTGCGSGSGGCGTVYSITVTGSEKVLYRFVAGTGGTNPSSGLVDVNGTLYGTTAYGGASYPNCVSGFGCGTVYSMTTAGSEKVLHNFGAGSDGYTPARLINVKRTLYGATEGGGTYGNGTVYGVTTGGTENVLYNFTKYPGNGQPFPTGLNDVGDTLYGTTQNGGVYYRGTVYTLRR
jgi:uncharacterized repeat protein (TIGR03803 family)